MALDKQPMELVQISSWVYSSPLISGGFRGVGTCTSTKQHAREDVNCVLVQGHPGVETYDDIIQTGGYVHVEYDSPSDVRARVP